ncbi:hypothetical protein PoB_002159300, partial [Plakobranchus ocellatus]
MRTVALEGKVSCPRPRYMTTVPVVSEQSVRQMVPTAYTYWAGGLAHPQLASTNFRH